MTLSKFKKSLKGSFVIIFLAVYGLGFFLLGKNSSLVNSFKVKGVQDQKTIDTPIETPIPYTDTQSAKITASFVKLCANTTYAYEVSYPKDWFTTYNTEDQKCTFFAPYSFVVPFDTTNFLIPVKIEIINPADWLGEVKFYENPNDFQNILTSENIEMEGKSVKKIEASTTGQGSIPKGFAKTTYLIFDDENPIVVSYQQTEEKENVEESKKVLGDIVASIKYY